MYINSLYRSYAKIIILSNLFTHSLEQIPEVIRPITILNYTLGPLGKHEPELPSEACTTRTCHHQQYCHRGSFQFVIIVIIVIVVVLVVIIIIIIIIISIILLLLLKLLLLLLLLILFLFLFLLLLLLLFLILLLLLVLLILLLVLLKYH